MNVRTYSVTLTAAAQAVTGDVTDQDEVSFQVTGTFTGLTLVPEVSVDGVNYDVCAVIPYASTTPTTAVASVGAAIGAWYARNLTTAVNFRVRCSAIATGSAVVTIIVGRQGRP